MSLQCHLMNDDAAVECGEPRRWREEWGKRRSGESGGSGGVGRVGKRRSEESGGSDGVGREGGEALSCVIQM